MGLIIRLLGEKQESQWILMKGISRKLPLGRLNFKAFQDLEWWFLKFHYIRGIPGSIGTYYSAQTTHPSSVTQPHSVEWSHSKEFSVGGPSHGGDRVVVKRTVIQDPTIAVPHLQIHITCSMWTLEYPRYLWAYLLLKGKFSIFYFWGENKFV